MKVKLALVFFGIALLPLSGFAEKEVGNGGDICEDYFKIVRDDIAAWIDKGGSAALSLPDNISVDRYNTEMLAQISKTHVSCTQDNVLIGDAEKTCKNFIDSQGTSRIVCNSDRFTKETSESDRYVLVHHEYAGLAGFEVNDGENSHYSVSNQISQYLTDTVVKRLAVKAPASPSMYQKISAKYETGTLPNLNTYFQKVAVGRCFWKDKPDSPFPIIFSIQRTELPDSGPLNPGPRYYYYAFFDAKNDNSIDSVNYQGVKGNIFDSVSQVDERTYSASYHFTISQGYALNVRQNGEYLVGKYVYLNFFGRDNEASCYFYRLND